MCGCLAEFVAISPQNVNGTFRMGHPHLCLIEVRVIPGPQLRGTRGTRLPACASATLFFAFSGKFVISLGLAFQDPSVTH